MDAWNQWNAQRATAAAVTAPGFQAPGAYPGAAAAGALAGPVPPAAAVPPSPAAPVGGYPMGYPYYGSAMSSATAVPGYNAQWAAMGAQQQNWQQWEQWQQQYAQWHQQYGTKYQEQLAAGVPGVTPAVGTAPSAVPTVPAPTLTSQASSADTSQMLSYSTDSYSQPKPQVDTKVTPSVGDKRSLDDIESGGAKSDTVPSESKKSKSSDSKKGETLEELIEAEKAFDVQFKNWESQFVKWKEQNVNHPDKTQYREYESKWESWREQLLQKREVMKKKRETKMEELKQESAKAAAELASASSAAQSLSTSSSITSMPPPVMGTTPSGYPNPTPGSASAPPGGFPGMMAAPPPMFGGPFGSGYNQTAYGGPMPPGQPQQPPFMMNAGQPGGPPPPPNMYPSMNMPPPMMNMSMPPMMGHPPPDPINSGQDKQSNSNFDQRKDSQSINSSLNFNSQSINKGIPGLDLLGSGNSAQGAGDNFGNKSGPSNFKEPPNKNQPLLKTSDDSKAFDFPKNEPPCGSRFTSGPGSGLGLGHQSSFGQPSSFGKDPNFPGGMQQPPFPQFNLPPPKGGGPGGFGDMSFNSKPNIRGLMDGFDSNRGPPGGFMDNKGNQEENRQRSGRFDEDFRGSSDSKFGGPNSRWSGGNDSPAKSGSRWGESEIPPDESTSFSRGSVGSRSDGPDKFKSSLGPNDEDDRYSGPRGNFRDRFPPRGGPGQFDRPESDFMNRPPFDDNKFGSKGQQDVDDRLGGTPSRFSGANKFGPRGGDVGGDGFDESDRYEDYDEDDRFMGPGPRGGSTDFPPLDDFNDRFSGPRGGPDDKPFGFKDGPSRFPGRRGGRDDGPPPDRFGRGRGFGDRKDNRAFGGPRGVDNEPDKFSGPGPRGPTEKQDQFPTRFPPARGGGGLLGDSPGDRFGGPNDGPDDSEDADDRDGPNRYFPPGRGGGRGGFGGRFGSGPRMGFDGPGSGFGFRGQGPSGNRFGAPNEGPPFDDRRGFGGPNDGSGDMAPNDRFSRGSSWNLPSDSKSPGRFGHDGRGDGPPPMQKGPVSLLDLPPIKPPPLLDQDEPAGPPFRGRPDQMDYPHEDDRFGSPNRKWGGPSSGPGLKDGPDEWKNRFSGPGPSPDRTPDWKMRQPAGGSGIPPFPHELQNDWELKPATVVDYGHRPRSMTGFSSEYDEPESVEPICTFDYEHGSKRAVLNRFESRFPNAGGPPDFDNRMQGNSRERAGGSGRDDRWHKDNRGPPPPRGAGGLARERDDRDRNKGPGSFNRDREDRDNDNRYRSNNSDFDNRRGGSNKNRNHNNRDRDIDDNKLQQSQPQQNVQEPRQPPVLIEDILNHPNRANRPPKIIIILRGPPGSGKTFVAKLIKDKEVEMSGSAPRILSLDDYFIVETEKEEKDPETGRKVMKKVMEYEYEAAMEEHYRSSLLKAFKKTIGDGYFPFIIVDCVNDKIKHYEEMFSFGKQNGFQVYITEMDLDISMCSKRNIHKRTEVDIKRIVDNWEQTPSSHTALDVRSLLQSAAITEVDMEDSTAETSGNDKNNISEKGGIGDDQDKAEDIEAMFTSKWDNMEFTGEKLDKLDGLVKARKCDSTIKDWLQLPDDYYDSSKDATPGKKKVRWADLEERREQEKMRAIGFVVGQTDWSRMMDPSLGGSKLTQTKYI